MNIGLCSGRHVMKTNEGEEMAMFVFDVVDNPTAIDVHEKVCRDFIKSMLHPVLFVYEGWKGHPEYDSPMDVNYEVQHEVSFLCYNTDCQPSEGEVE